MLRRGLALDLRIKYGLTSLQMSPFTRLSVDLTKHQQVMCFIANESRKF